MISPEQSGDIKKNYCGHKIELFLDNLGNQELDNLRDHKHEYEFILSPIKHLCKEINSKQIKYNSQLAISEHQFDYLSVQMLRVILSELVRLGLDIVVFRDNYGYRFNDYVEIFWNKTSC